MAFLKRIGLWGVIFSLAGGSGNGFALEQGLEKASVTVAQSYVSRYIWRGQDLFGDNDPAYQPDIEITFPEALAGTDLSLNLWGSFPLSRGHEDAEELDYTLTFSRDFSKSFSFSAGYTYFDYPNTAGTADVSEPWLSLSLNKVPALPIEISATVFAGYDFQTRSGGVDEGWYYSWGLATELPLPEFPLFQEKQALGIGAVNWGNDGTADLKPSALYATELSLSTAYNLGSFTVSPSFHYTINYEDAINNGDEEAWGGIEVSYQF